MSKQQPNKSYINLIDIAFIPKLLNSWKAQDATVIRMCHVGAGQDVGRSCILLTIGGKNVMLDCGMHMGYNNEKRFPDFRYIAEGPLTDHLDCVIISHFHLDHCGALPYMTEMVGYNGPIYMTTPTKAICPILLEDYRKITVEKKGEKNFFSSAMIRDCMKKVITVNLHQTIEVDEELKIKAYYAGHVLGAAMFLVKVGSQSVVYTGDFNMTPDRHLGAAWIDKCRPNVLITESTYATTIRDSKRCRERDFLMKVHDCVERGGKVLIPVFALGRAQELCILLETYWERMNLKIPIYFAAGLTEKATAFYKMFITWTNQKIRETFVHRNMFEFKHIKSFDRAYIDNPGPMVVFATPGMLHSGLSLQIFRRWAPNKNNMLIMPGYCVSGTVGHKVLSGAEKIEFENRQIVEVKMAVEYMSFSAHADAKGIMQLIRHCEPDKVLLVHGEASKMQFLKKKITQEMGLECFMPANGETVTIPTKVMIPIDCSLKLLKRQIAEQGGMDNKKYIPLHGVLMMKNNKLKLLDAEDAMAEVGIRPHIFRVTTTVKLEDPSGSPPARIADSIYRMIKEDVEGSNFQLSSDASITFKSILIKVDNADDDSKNVCLSWAYQDAELGLHLLKRIKSFTSCIK